MSHKLHSAMTDSLFFGLSLGRDSTRLWNSRRPKVRIRRCAGCSKWFKPTEERYGKYCSRECRFAYVHAHACRLIPLKVLEERKCRQCGTSFYSGTGRRVLCDSEACKRADDTQRAYDNYKQMHTECVRCGVELPSNRSGARQCVVCLRVAKNQHNKERKARKRGASSERFDVVEIFVRDGWRCQVCRCKVRPTFDVNHKRYPNLDHIVPLSNGGAHVRANVQCLCRACNMRKSNIGEGQLRLIG